MDDRKFELVSPFKPTGDQPKAIAELIAGLHAGKKEQVLEGATGTGKTFTMAIYQEKEICLKSRFITLQKKEINIF